ncbi:MAG: hypothetical protein ACLFO3_06370 [Candidatus Acetothermia bacterium]
MENLDRETIINALENLSEEIVTELQAQDVPEEDISRFNEEFGSALTLFEEGLFTRGQLGEEATGATNRLGREVEDGLPVELLEENGINTEAIQQLKEGAENLSGPEVAKIVRSIAGKEEEGAEEKEDKGREENGEDRGKGQGKGEEEGENGRDKGESESEGNSGNNGRP